MRYLCLATDYDGTLAADGRVSDEAVKALRRLRESGRRVVLVTGRELPDLQRAFEHLDLFDLVVAENGALLHRPEGNETRVLAERPPAGFVEALERAGVEPLSVGHVVVATWEPNETKVLEVIREQGLELQVIFNKGAVMVLPSGVNKATGLLAALEDLGLSPHNVVGVGDAQNDLAFLGLCECSIAVANALESVKGASDHVTRGDHGDGVVEVVERLLEDDLNGLDRRLRRNDVRIGYRGGDEGEEILVPPASVAVMIAGPSGSGKSTLATGFLERLLDRGYQFCLVDPEGDYERFEGAVVLGAAHRAPTVEEALAVIRRPGESVVLNLLGVRLHDRPDFFGALVPRLQEFRTQTGRPHWVVIDEAHHLLPAARDDVSLALPRDFGATLLITVHPEHVKREVLSAVDLLLVVAPDPEPTVRSFAEARDLETPRVPGLEKGQALMWWPQEDPVAFDVAPPAQERERHRRKYAEGDLGEERSFRFRGPEGRLNLQAQNLHLFSQLAEGVDLETWEHHLREGDYSRWLRECVKDAELGEAVERIERDRAIDAEESRRRIIALLDERYTLPG